MTDVSRYCVECERLTLELEQLRSEMACEYCHTSLFGGACECDESDTDRSHADDAVRINDELRAEVERMRPVVKTALAWRDPNFVNGVATAEEGDAAEVAHCAAIDAYRKASNG